MNPTEKLIAAVIIAITLMREERNVGTFDTLEAQDATGNRLVKGKSLQALHALLAEYGIVLPPEYTVTKYVAWAINGSKARPSVLGQFDKVVSQPTHAPAKATFVTGTIVDSSPVAQPDQSDAAVRREAAMALASQYRMVCAHNSKTNATPEVREANLLQKIPGTSITYKRAGELARLIDPTYNV